jgi:hypothetical protein
LDCLVEVQIGPGDTLAGAGLDGQYELTMELAEVSKPLFIEGGHG